MSEKIKITPMIVDGEEFLPKDVLEDILEMMDISVSSSYSSAYRAPRYPEWLEPDEPADLEVSVDISVSLEEIEKKYLLDEKTKKLLIDSISETDLYEEEIDNFKEAIEDSVSSECPGYKVCSASTSLCLNKAKTVLCFEYEIDDYEFDDYEFHEANRPEPDPYDREDW